MTIIIYSLLCMFATFSNSSKSISIFEWGLLYLSWQRPNIFWTENQASELTPKLLSVFKFVLNSYQAVNWKILNAIPFEKVKGFENYAKKRLIQRIA